MKIRIMATESLGVRGLCCTVVLGNRKILIDPGIALGWSRHGFLPHPFQIAVGVELRERIVAEMQDATDVVFSHFHGDHCPLLNPNPYQLGIDRIMHSLNHCQIWAKNTETCMQVQWKRKDDLSDIPGVALQNAEGQTVGPLAFSIAVPHGNTGGTSNTVMMTKITEGSESFVHASDIQLLDDYTVDLIVEWRPDVVLVSGPPLYHFNSSSFQMQRERAWMNAVRLSEHVETLIIDHHLLRSEEGMEWLESLKRAVSHKVLCAAEFMEKPPLLLEAWREDLYRWLPVAEDWHVKYQSGQVDPEEYRIRGWKLLAKKKNIDKHALFEL